MTPITTCRNHGTATIMFKGQLCPHCNLLEVATRQAREIKSYRKLESDVFAHNERQRAAGELRVEKIVSEEI